MPRLFDLLSENTDDKTISALRRIAGGKKNGRPARAEPGDGRQARTMADIVAGIDFVSLDLETTGLDDKTDSYMLQGCYFHLKNYIRKSQDSATLLSLNSIMEEDGPHLEEILVAKDLASYDQVEGALQIEAVAGSGASQRERAVLFFSLEGMTTREIGKRLGISHVSVVKIRNKIKEKYRQLNGGAAANGAGSVIRAAAYRSRASSSGPSRSTPIYREASSF